MEGFGVECGFVFFGFIFAVVLFGVSPDGFWSDAEAGMFVGFVPEYLVFDAVRGGVVMYDETFIVLCALVHDGAKQFEVGEHTGILFIDSFAIGHIGVAEDEDEVDIGA